MINIFKIKNNNLIKIKIYKKKKIKKYIWVDLINPTEKERQYVKKKLKQKIIKKPKLFNLEASSRFFKDKEGIHVHSFFFYKDTKDYMNNSTVAFTIKNNKIYSLRDIELPVFRLYRIKNKNKTLLDYNPYDLLLNLFEIKIDQLANEIENVYKDLEYLTYIILRDQNNQKFNKSISILSKKEDITSKIRICLIDTQRALNFLIKENILKYSQRELSREIIRDTESLIPHNESIFQKINFLMQAAMGFLNIEQNRIIKIFSVISVIFLPPSLLTSTYGMNFKNIPELNWKYGYPITLIIMFILSLISYIYFKLKKWL